MTEACSKSSLIGLAKPDSTSLFGGESITVWRTRSILNAGALRLTRRLALAFGPGFVVPDEFSYVSDFTKGLGNLAALTLH